MSFIIFCLIGAALAQLEGLPFIQRQIKLFNEAVGKASLRLTKEEVAGLASTKKN